MLKRLYKDENGLIGIIALVLIGGGIIFAILMWAVIDMLTKNILPICIGIALVITLPIVAKGWYYSKTKKEYPKGGGLFS